MSSPLEQLKQTRQKATEATQSRARTEIRLEAAQSAIQQSLAELQALGATPDNAAQKASEAEERAKVLIEQARTAIEETGL